MLASPDKKQAIVTEICKSKTFSNAPTSIALLKYLFKSTLNNIDLKEAVVELEFFRKETDSKKDNPKVRVNVYNLRNKLNKYYELEGKNDDYRLFIDKGQYLVRFEKNNAKRLLTGKINYSRLVLSLLVVALGTLLIITNLIPRPPVLWKSFLSKKTNTTLFIGDVFGMMGTTITGGDGWTRDYGINNLEEFYSFSNSHPELKKKLAPPPYAYTTQMGVLSAKYMQSLFSAYKKDFTIRFISKSSIDDIKDGNVIYVGPIKNNNLFIEFFNEANPYFAIHDSIIYLTNHPSLPDTTFLLSYQVSDEELAIVSKIPGPNNTEQFLFFSNHDIGVSSTFQFFTNKDSIESFAQKYLNNHKYFTALFRAKGQNRTDTDLKLLLVTKI